MVRLFSRTRLVEPAQIEGTFPSWRPRRNIDHILVTSGLTVEECRVVNHPYSDHLPVAMDIRLPEGLHESLHGGESESQHG